MGLTNLFPTPIYTIQARGDKFDDIQHELKTLYNKVNFEHLPYAPDAHNVSTDMEGNFFRGCMLTAYECNHFLKFLDFGIRNYVYQIENKLAQNAPSQNVEWKHPMEYTITESWFTKTLHNQYAPYHNHGDSDISGVYYLNTNGEDGDLKIRSPHEMFVGNYLYSMITRGSEAGIKLENGVLGLWPSILHHATNPNNTDHERISLSFNITFNRQGFNVAASHYHKFFEDEEANNNPRVK